jgi:amidase
LGSGTQDEFWRWPATQVARAVAAGQVSAREVTESCLTRIGAVNPQLNALVEVRAEQAMEAAAEADQRTAAGAELGPLHGVPVAIKANTDQAGYATTDGVVAFRDNIAAADSPQAASLRRAGAILVGRSNCPAFSFRWMTTNDLHGRTLNPWDRARTPGGSSGGASSAVAAGMVPIAHGNDIGGSIRYPAYTCGIAGLRPTPGRVASAFSPAETDFPLASQVMAVDGPLARSVSDIRLAMRGMADPDPRDPVHVPGAPAAPPAERPVRVALVRDHGAGTPAADAVGAALDQAAGWLGDAGYMVEEAELPLLAEAYRLWWLLVMEEFRLLMPMVEQMGDDGMKKAAEYYYSVAAEWWGSQPGLTEYLTGYARRGTLMRMLSEFMARYPLVLLPVSAEQAFGQDEDIASLDRARQVIAAQAPMMAVPVLGFPAVSVPTGVAGGLPAGVQLLGRRFDEDGILDAAEVIEARVGVLTPIDPR